MGTLFNSPTTREPRSGDIPVWDAKIRQWVPSNRGQGVSVSPGLPAFGKNDDEFVYQAATGVYWTFKYDATNGYWNFIGGPPLVATNGASFAATATSTWMDTVSPAVSAPFFGDYNVTVQAIGQSLTAGIVEEQYGANVGSITPSTADDVFFQATTRMSLKWTVVGTGVSAGYSIRPSFWQGGATPANATVANRSIFVIPIRVH